jgi:hypothetical protein
MACKACFRPLERLGPNGWHRFEPDQRELPLVWLVAASPR